MKNKDKFDFKFTYGKEEDTIEDLIFRLEDDNGDADSYTGISMMYIDYILKFNEKKYILCGYILLYFPNFFNIIKNRENKKIYLTGASKGKLGFSFIKKNQVRLYFEYDHKEYLEIEIDIVDFLKPFYEEFYKLIQFFEENGNEKLIPISFKYMRGMKKYLDENPINSYLKDE